MGNEPGRQPPLITLTTDFGLLDEYVGTVKGVILSHCRDAIIVDLTHGITPQNIAEAARTIEASFRFFPQGTIHMVVVDPGVGTARKILAVRAEGHLFVAPDNGVLTSILGEDNLLDIFQINNRKLFAATISPSFHGRDIMAPVAARLACGMDISSVGPRLPSGECCRIPLTSAKFIDGNIRGEIIHIDHFGNLRTNITGEDLSQVPPGATIKISVGGHCVKAISSAYASEEGILALLDSRNHLEIASKDGSAAKELGCRTGEKVLIVVSRPKEE